MGVKTFESGDNGKREACNFSLFVVLHRYIYKPTIVFIMNTNQYKVQTT